MRQPTTADPAITIEPVITGWNGLDGLKGDHPILAYTTDSDVRIDAWIQNIPLD